MNTTRPLATRQLNELRDELEAERDRLAHAIARNESMAAAASATGTTATAGSGSDGDLGVAVTSRRQERHEAIEDALRRLEEGSYGVCVSCRYPIPYGRLLVMPETRYCVACGARA